MKPISFIAGNKSRLLLLAAVATGVLGMQAGRGTMAYFTTTVTSTGNAFTAGNLNFNINSHLNNGAGLLTVASTLTLPLMRPGDAVYAPITLTNVGTIDGRYGIQYTVTPGTIAGGAGTGTGDLTPNLSIGIIGSGSGNATAADCTYAKLLAAVETWHEQIIPYTGSADQTSLPFGGTPNLSGTPGTVVAGLVTVPGVLKTYDNTDATAVPPAYLGLAHSATDVLCVRIGLQNTGDPMTGLSGAALIADPFGLAHGDNVINTGKVLSTSIDFRFDGLALVPGVAQNQ